MQPEKSKADPTSDKGSRPGVRGAGPSGPVLGYQEEWKFHPNIRIKEAEKKEIIARDCCIRDVLHTCVYICRSFYRQILGYPIGLRSTFDVARLVMKVWDDKSLARPQELKVQLGEAIRNRLRRKWTMKRKMLG